VEGDVFDRQRCIVGFDQGLVEKQRCFVLGTGGIGQDVALTLARLGVGKIVLLDFDTYDASNLTRQCLGAPSDVGSRKVDAAARCLREYHNLRSEIETMHCNVLTEWPRVVEAARNCDVIFNGVDVGSMFDYCANSLAKELGIPLLQGQSYGWTFNVEFYSSRPGATCLSCSQTTASAFYANKSAISKEHGILDDLVKFASAKGHGDALDAAAMATFLSECGEIRMQGPTVPEISTIAIAKLAGEAVSLTDGGDSLLAFMTAVQEECETRLAPGKISGLPEVEFIPHPPHVVTRFVGSWVCPCLMAGVMMVSQWMNYLTGPTTKDPPTNFSLNLNDGMTDSEVEMKGMAEAGAEMGMSWPPEFLADPRERVVASSKSSPTCKVCNPPV